MIKFTLKDTVCGEVKVRSIIYVSNYILNSRNIFLEIVQAFAHCCELPQDWRKCCSCNLFITPWGVWENVYLHNFILYWLMVLPTVVVCLNHLNDCKHQADVIAWCWLIYLPLYWQLFLSPLGWCYCLLYCYC